MKKILLLVPMVALLAAGCNYGKQSSTSTPATTGNQIDTSSWKTYSNEPYAYEYKYPTDWTFTHYTATPVGVEDVVKKGEAIFMVHPDGDDGETVRKSETTQGILAGEKVYIFKRGTGTDYFFINHCKNNTDPDYLDPIGCFTITTWPGINDYDENVLNTILSTFKFTQTQSAVTTSNPTANTKIFTNTQYGFELQYPDKSLLVAKGVVSTSDPKGLVYVVNINTIPHGSDRDGLVGVFDQSLIKTLESLGFTRQNLTTVSYNGVTWTKLPQQDAPSSYLTEKNGKTFWLVYDSKIKQADFETIITTFKFTK